MLRGGRGTVRYAGIDRTAILRRPIENRRTDSCRPPRVSDGRSFTLSCTLTKTGPPAWPRSRSRPPALARSAADPSIRAIRGGHPTAPARRPCQWRAWATDRVHGPAWDARNGGPADPAHCFAYPGRVALERAHVGITHRRIYGPIRHDAKPKISPRGGPRGLLSRYAKSRESACFVVVGGTGIEPVTPAV
jgi:hypothetical protein